MRARLLPVLLLVAVGCADDTKPAALPAGGTVTFQGKPATGALVVFHPVDLAFEQKIGGKPQGRVKDDGTFALTMFAQDDGAPPGEYGVTVDWRGEAKAAKLSLGGEGATGEDKLKGRGFGDPRSPKFKFTVKKGDPNKFEIKLD